jgi:hypothetical protein
VLARWIERTRGRDKDEDRGTYLLYAVLQPHPPA